MTVTESHSRGQSKPFAEDRHTGSWENRSRDSVRTCSRCVSDTTLGQSISFDEDGVCNFCRLHDILDEMYPLNEQGSAQLERLVSRIKKAGRGRKYDCVVGVSGGRDSTFLMYRAVQLGLRPIAVHFDNSWNSDIAVTNIKRACSALNVDLHTIVADWEEFKDLQVAFLEASVPEAEIPTDVAIGGALYSVAAQEGIKHILLGHSFRTESICPIDWTYMDGRYVRAVQRRFGTISPTTVPTLTIGRFLYHRLVRGIKAVPFLYLLHYSHGAAQEILERELGWQYYGGHHHESRYTHFFQSYYLPRKFGFDKRKLEYSALIRSGQMTRDDALREIQETPYPFDEELVDFCLKKLGLSRERFERIMAAKPKSFRDYPTYYPLLQKFEPLLRIGAQLGLIHPIMYYKFFSAKAFAIGARRPATTAFPASPSQIEKAA